MKSLTILLALLLFAVSQGAYAQKTITGKVINGEDRLGMPGVSVVVKGTTTGMSTDNEGNFTLNVPNDATLQVSFIGFKTVEIPVENETRFDITLQPDAQVLGDVVVTAARVIPPERAVVTAMGIVRDKITLAYSTESISGDEIIRGGGIGGENPLLVLNGRTAGVRVEKDGQGPGVPVMVLIRGKTSWSNSSAPLLVLDGIPMGRLTGGMNDPLAGLDSNNIEDITILKSANAAMLYGSEAANGAVVITTKR